MIVCGDAIVELKKLEEKNVNCCVTSPPYYGLRDYGIDGQVGLNQTVDEYVEKLVSIFREVKRVLRDDGTLWLNLGDTYAANGIPGGNNFTKLGEKYSGGGIKQDTIKKPKKSIPFGLKNKDLIGIPWRVAFALQSDGWYLRADIIWHKPNAMPESVTDRPTKAHEYIFLLSKNKKYYYDNESVKEDAVGEHKGNAATFKRSESKREKAIPNQQKGTHRPDREVVEYNGAKRNRRSVWSVSTKSFKEAHFAVFPERLIEPCILAGCPEGGTVIDPFFGAGTTGKVSLRLKRKFIGIDLNQEYCDLARRRIYE